MYAKLALPLTDLTKGKAPEKLKWGPEQDQAFQELKRCLVEPPILKMADFNVNFILKVDASDYALGAALVRETDGREFPVAYASKNLLTRECRYATIEKVCLAIVWAVKHFEFFLYGQLFDIHTDHRTPLVSFGAEIHIKETPKMGNGPPAAPLPSDRCSWEGKIYGRLPEQEGSPIISVSSCEKMIWTWHLGLCSIFLH